MSKGHYRPNVAMVLVDAKGRLFWGRSVNRGNHWQFPQGGIDPGESAEQALYRELQEELGLCADAVRPVAVTDGWLHYRVPNRYKRNKRSDFLGQKQKWFLLQYLGDDSQLRLDAHEVAEFDDWRWVSYWYPLGQIVHFKRSVYRRALLELAPAYGRLLQC